MATIDFGNYGLGLLAILHAGSAAVVTRLTLERDRAGLWKRVFKSLTASTLLLATPFAVTLVVLAEMYGRAHPSLLVDNALSTAAALGGFWVGSITLGGLASLAVHRLSPLLAASALFVLLVTPPLAFAVNGALNVHHARTHWHCVHYTHET